MPGWLLALVLAAPAAAAQAHEDVRAREAAAFADARAGEYAASTEAFTQLLADEPLSERACLWRERMFLNAAARGEPAAMWDAAEQLVAGWVALHDQPGHAALRRVCHDDAAEALRYLAARWHHEGREQHDDALLALAERAYRTSLATFAERAYELEFSLAELLSLRAYVVILRASESRPRRRPWPRCSPAGPRAGDPPYCAHWHAARDAYVRLLERDPDGRHTERAAYAQLLLASWLTDFTTREDGRACKTNREGVCVARPGVRWFYPCDDPFGPTTACLKHLKRADRWPIVPFGGLGWHVPFSFALSSH